VLPTSRRDVNRIAAECRARVTRRALVSAGATVVPIPGLDLMVDIGLMVRMLNEVNEAFGLTPAQIEQLSPRRKLTVYAAVNALGSSAVGRLVTRELIALLLKRVARRVAAASVLRFVPLAGQAVAASLSFAALKYLGNRHIADCVRVAEAVVDVKE
jgi:uncharacterized protein (DUF697 family)